MQQLNAQGFVYENVGHIKQTTSPDATYRYTGDGWRVRKATGSLVSYHLRGPGGDLLTEVTDATGSPVLTDYIYAAGRLIAVVRKTF